MKHIDFYVEQDPTLHPKIELGAFSNTTLLSSINVIYRPTTRTMFGASPLDDPETQRLSTYNDIPLNEKLSNDLIRTHIYGISPDFDVANIKTTGYAPALMSRPMLAVSSPTSTCTRSQESVEPSGPSEEGSGDTESENLNFVTIDVKQFLAELELERSGMTSSSKRVAMSAPVPVAASPTPATLTTFFEFNDDKTELTNWKHD